MEKKGKYDSIIHLPHHVSPTRRRMTMVERGAQFSPFAALTGYGAAVEEAGRLTSSRQTLSEEEAALLDRKQQLLREMVAERPRVTVTYFVEDDQKEGGAYVTLSGHLKRMDLFHRQMVLEEGISIPLDDIAAIEGECFRSIETE